MNIPEETFSSWAQGPGKTESEKCANAEASVRKAIQADEKLSSEDITIFAQGSYRARTNIRQDSDVDICIRYNSTFFPEYPSGTTKETFGNVDGTMSFADFKNMVEKALNNYFGTASVTRGNKAFDVHANSYRIDADVVPTFEHRRYVVRQDGSYDYISGVAFETDDDGMRIKNWPDQTYSNGVEKNDATNRCYKRVIRIMKRLKNVMEEEGIKEAKNVASFLIECLVWNAPNKAFAHTSYLNDVRYVIADIWNRTKRYEDCSQWGEVNELKYLFRDSQPWSYSQANVFLHAAWNFIGYK